MGASEILKFSFEPVNVLLGSGADGSLGLAIVCSLAGKL
jgi:hypothetical protein